MRLRKSRGNVRAERAVADASQTLNEVRGRAQEVRETAAAMRILREKNHFREQLEWTMGGRNAPKR